MLTIAKPSASILRNSAAICILAAALSACGGTKWGFPYRADVQQGNWVTAEQVARLETGMTREQVRYILGTPTLQDIFHAERWDYPYYNKPGYGDPDGRSFTVWFENDQLVRWEGDQQPNYQPFQTPDAESPAAETNSNGAIQPELPSASNPAAEAVDAAALPVDAPTAPETAQEQSTVQPLR